jgi:hypothetical protein
MMSVGQKHHKLIGPKHKLIGPKDKMLKIDLSGGK